MTFRPLFLAILLGSVAPALAQTSLTDKLNEIAKGIGGDGQTATQGQTTTTTTTETAPPPPAGGGQLITAQNPQEIADFLQAMGYRAQLTTDDQGDPKIDSSTSGANYSIYFYGCEGGQNCASIQFSSGFDLTEGTTLEIVNDWNTKKRYAKVYLDDQGDPFIEVDVNMYGGISPETLTEVVLAWDTLLADFQTHINW